MKYMISIIKKNAERESKVFRRLPDITPKCSRGRGSVECAPALWNRRAGPPGDSLPQAARRAKGAGAPEAMRVSSRALDFSVGMRN